MSVMNNIPAYYLQRAIARVETTGVDVGTAKVTYNFRNHPYVMGSYNGIVIIKINQPIPEATTQTLPVYFNSGSGDKAVIKHNGAAATVADFSGTGVYLFYYDSTNGVIQTIAKGI